MKRHDRRSAQALSATRDQRRPFVVLLFAVACVAALLVVRGAHAQTADAGSAPAGSSAMPVASMSSADTAALTAYRWKLMQAKDRQGHRLVVLFASSKPAPELTFSSDGRFGVAHLCNAMGAHYEVSQSRLQLGGMLHTMMACHDPALMGAEHGLLQRLQSRPTLSLSRHHGTIGLKLVTDQGDVLRFTGVPVAASTPAA